MISGHGCDFGVGEIVAVSLLRVPVLSSFKERPGVMYHESVYVVHRENSAVPGLAVDRNGIDQFHVLGGGPLCCSRISERVLRLGWGGTPSRSR